MPPVPSTPAHARFDALTAEHRGIVYKVAATYTRDPEERRDLAQEILAAAWRSFGRYDPARPFATWLYRVALNVAISHARRASRRRARIEPLDDGAPEPAADADPEPDERVRLLYGVIGRLGDLDRALVLLYLDERSHREIGEVLGLTETNVATRLSRLKKRLRDDLAAAL